MHVACLDLLFEEHEHCDVLQIWLFVLEPDNDAV